MYEIFAHTADVGIRARAGDLNELFAEAARGLFAVMVANLDETKVIETLEFQLADDNLEELLHDWLAELLYTFHSRRVVFVDFRVQVTPTGLSATVSGEPIDMHRHEIDMEVKAITWHALRVERQPNGWLAEVIVDV